MARALPPKIAAKRLRNIGLPGWMALLVPNATLGVRGSRGFAMKHFEADQGQPIER